MLLMEKNKKSVPSFQSSLMRAFSRALRLAEFSAAFLLIAYTTKHIPAFFSCLRRLATGLLHPHFIFLLGNSIVALLLHLSRHLPSSSSSSSSSSSAASSTPQLYLELMQAHESIVNPTQPEVVFEDKETVSVEPPRKFTRSKSEKFEKKRRDDKLLRRSDTEVMRDQKKKKKGGVLEEEEEESRFSVEEDDAFRKMVEEFIAKQARFHRQESMGAIVEA